MSNQSITSTSSSSSVSSMSTTNSTVILSSTPRRPASTRPAPSIAALPSFAHSLSSFPGMTSVTNDMVHYGTPGHSKSISQAKLNVVLQTTKQRRDGQLHSPLALSPSSASGGGFPKGQDDEQQLLVMTRKKANKASSVKSAA